MQEDFLAHIGFPEHELIKSGIGVPIVDLKTEFLGMCRNGDQLLLSLTLSKIGNASLGMQYEITAAGDAYGEQPTVRLRAHGIVVYSQVPGGKALRIPDNLRAALTPYLDTAA